MAFCPTFKYQQLANFILILLKFDFKNFGRLNEWSFSTVISCAKEVPVKQNLVVKNAVFFQILGDNFFSLESCGNVAQITPSAPSCVWDRGLLRTVSNTKDEAFYENSYRLKAPWGLIEIFDQLSLWCYKRWKKDLYTSMKQLSL